VRTGRSRIDPHSRNRFCLFLPMNVDRLWDPTSLVQNGYQRLFFSPDLKVKKSQNLHSIIRFQGVLHKHRDGFVWILFFNTEFILNLWSSFGHETYGWTVIQTWYSRHVLVLCISCKDIWWLHGVVPLEKLIFAQLLKKFPRLSCNPNVHGRVLKNPPLVPILSQTNPCDVWGYGCDY
jgi:hypothetical protein